MGAENYINGDKHYSWGDGTNDCSPKQEYIVKLITKALGVRPKNMNTKVVYKFINENYEPAGLPAMHRIRYPEDVLKRQKLHNSRKRR